MVEVEFLHTMAPTGAPRHELLFKVGTPIMLIRNLRPAEGLCNGTRLLVKHGGAFLQLGDGQAQGASTALGCGEVGVARLRESRHPPPHTRRLQQATTPPHSPLPCSRTQVSKTGWSQCGTW